MYSSLLPNLQKKWGKETLESDQVVRKRKETKWKHNTLGEVCQILHDFGNEGERAWRLLIGILLGEVKEGGGHDGGTQESQEERAADEAVGDVFAASLCTAHPPGGKDFL